MESIIYRNKVIHTLIWTCSTHWMKGWGYIRSSVILYISDLQVSFDLRVQQKKSGRLYIWAVVWSVARSFGCTQRFYRQEQTYQTRPYWSLLDYTLLYCTLYTVQNTLVPLEDYQLLLIDHFWWPAYIYYCHLRHLTAQNNTTNMYWSLSCTVHCTLSCTLYCTLHCTVE